MKSVLFFPLGKAMLVAVIILNSLMVFGQAGSSQSNPIQVGTLASGATYTNQHAGFQQEVLHVVFYRFVLSSAANIDLSSITTANNLIFQLLNSSGQVIETRSAVGLVMGPNPGESGSGIMFSKFLQAGTYFVKISKGGAAVQRLRLYHNPTEVQTAFRQQMNNVLGQLEFNRIPHALLRDAALEFVNLDNYRGTALTDTNYVDNTEFFSLQQSIVTARIGPNAPSLITSEELSARQEQAESEGRIVISGLFYQYSQIKANAVQNNQIQVVNNQLKDRYVNGVWQNPYETVRTVAFAPTMPSYSGRTQNFRLPSNLWMTNAQSSVSSIQVNLGDGQGYRTLAPGTTGITITYPTTGPKILVFRINLTDNTSLLSHSRMDIRPSFGDGFENRTEVLEVTSPETLDGIAGRGYMSIRYANADKKMRKPLIIAEGFDPGHILNPSKKYGETDLETFMDEIIDLDIGHPLYNLLIGNQQYDIVYVDYRYGTDNIKRNALLLKEVIRIVNTRKAQAGSTQKNVVWGESMGGLVARWALKSMENQSENHQVRLFISYDSPHLGANIPLGYQHMANHVKRLYIQTGVGVPHEIIAPIANWRSPGTILGMASTPAARQMLINYVAPNGAIDNSVHHTWQTELRNLGYPSGFSGSPLKNIAVSNGTVCGTFQQSTPNSLLLAYSGKGNTKVLGDILGGALLPMIADHTRLVQFYLGTLPGRNEIKFNISVNAVGSSGGNRVYYNNITYTKRVLWLIPINVTISSDARNAPGGALPFDSYAGGYYNTTVNPSNSQQSNWFFKYNITASAIPRFSFIPAVSALDIGRGSQTLTNADYTSGYSGANPPPAPKNSPFANFITVRANDDNTVHTSINGNTGTWIATELNGNNGAVDDCSYICSNALSINGPANLCGASTYQLAGLTAGPSVTWSAVPANAVTISGSGGTVTVTPTTNFGSQFTLRASVNGTCGVRVVERVILKGTPAVHDVILNNYVGMEGIFCTNVFDNSYEIVTSPYDPSASYEVQIVRVSNMSVVHTTTTSSLFNYLSYSGSPGQYQIRVRVINHPCGNSQWTAIPFNFVQCTGFTWKVYPNPADDTLTVSATEADMMSGQDSKPSDNPSFNITLYDSMGRVHKAENSREGKVMLDTSRIPEGTYFLHVKFGDKIEKHQIVIKHR